MSGTKHAIKDVVRSIREKIGENKESLSVIYLVGLVGTLLFFGFPDSNDLIITPTVIDDNIFVYLFISLCFSFAIYIIFIIAHIITYSVLYIFLLLIILLIRSLYSVYSRYLKYETVKVEDRRSEFDKYLDDTLKKEKENGNELVFDEKYKNTLTGNDFSKWFFFKIFYFVNGGLTIFQLLSELNGDLEIPTPAFVAGLLFVVFTYIPFYYAFMIYKIRLYNTGWFVKSTKTGTTRRLGTDLDIDVKTTVFSLQFIIISGLSAFVWLVEFLKTLDIRLFLVENSAMVGVGLITFSALMFEGLVVFLMYAKNKD
ncbi:MAG: hypothetical protein ACFFD4_12845 [Candidatus Odinarchaeota archaeon]